MTVFLETERLILKKTEQLDLDYLFALQAESDVMEYTRYGKLQTKEEAQKALVSILSYQEKHEYNMYFVFDKKAALLLDKQVISYWFS